MRLRFALLTLATIAGGSAHADMGTLPDGASIQFGRFWLHEVANPATHPNGEAPGTLQAQPLSVPNSLWRYFDYAHCVCDEPATRNIPSPDPNVQDPLKKETTFAWELLLSGQTTLNDLHFPAQIWTGPMSCDVPGITGQAEYCTEANSISDLSTLSPTGSSPEVHVFDLMNPGVDPTTMMPYTTCTQNPAFTMGVYWVVASTMGAGTPDFSISTSMNLTVDTFPPPLPTNLVASPAENAVNFSWQMPSGDTSDIFAFQALCANEDGTPALASPSNGPLYLTPRTLCGDPQDITWTAIGSTPTTLPDAGVVDGAIPTDAGGLDAPLDANLPLDGGLPPGQTPPIQGIAQLDPAYVCGQTTDMSATSLRVEGLQNGKNYYVALVVVDKFQNAIGQFTPSTITPQAVTDFWEDLHDRGSHVEGGFCLLAETYGDRSGPTNALRAFRDDNLASNPAGRAVIDFYYAHVAPLGAQVHGSIALRYVAFYVTEPFVVVALAWHYLTLPGLLGLIGLALLARRNRRRVLALRAVKLATAATALVALLAMPRHAHAQAQPYWETSDDTNEEEALEDHSKDIGWHAGFRLGPYVPQIDAQLGGPQPGPYRQMFGKGGIMPAIDVDKIVFHTAYGQIGFGGTVGYLHRSANAFLDNSNPTDADRGRSAGDTNSFTLVPIAATAIFRFTYLDDELGIPIVPYARAGLSYYVWWIDAPDGNFAQVCENGGVEPNCMQNKAAGASLGVQGSLGIAIRAERIDATAASYMREAGIEHAGFYAEIQSGKVDGFGSDTKLSVGDTTWFAGVDFEF